MSKINLCEDKIGLHGKIYQIKLLMLFLYRGVTQNYSFNLGTEVSEAGKFEDLVFEYTTNSGTFYRLLQAKHKLRESKKITADSLFPKNDTDFSLMKYFFSYQKLKYDKLFENGSIENVTLCTNIDFDIRDLHCKGIEIEEVVTIDTILDTKCSFKHPIRYRFKESIVPILSNLVKEPYTEKLAKCLVEFLLKGRMISSEDNSIKVFQKALSKEVIDVKNKVFYDKFIKGGQLSPTAQGLRTSFEREIREQTGNVLTMENLNDALKEKILINGRRIGLLLHKKFGLYSDYELKTFDDVDIFSNTIGHCVTEFIDRLVFAVRQLNEEELGKVIEAEIGSQFNKLTTRHVNYKLFHHMLDFLQGKRKLKRFFSSDEGRKLIEDARKEILCYLNSGFKDHLDGIPYYFNIKDDLQNFLLSSNSLWLLSSETPWLNSLFLHQNIKSGNHELCYNNYKWNDLLENKGNFISEFKGLRDILLVLTCLQMTDMREMSGIIVQKIDDLLNDNHPSNKVIVIASNGHELMAQLRIKFNEFHRKKVNIAFSNLKDESQSTLLNKKNVCFRGYLKNISITQLLCSEGRTLSPDQINLLNLDASSLEILIRNQKIKVWDENYHVDDFGPENFKTNTLLEFHKLKEAITKNTTDAFAIIGDETKIRILLRNLPAEPKKLKSAKSPFHHDRIILLNSENEQMEFNQLCQIATDCECENETHVLHKIKYEGDEFIWKQTYCPNLYIPRFINLVFINLKHLEHQIMSSNSTEFIILSKIKKKELFSVFNINLEGASHFKNNCALEFSVKSAEKIFNCMKQKINEEEIYEPDDSYKKVLHLNTKKKIHWIHKWESNCLPYFEWYQSVGDVIELRKALMKGVDYAILPEMNFTKLKQRLILISDQPGKGKSSTLVHFLNLMKKEKKKSIAIKIDLNLHQDLFIPTSVNTKQGTIDFLLNFCTDSANKPLNRRILSFKFEFLEKVILLCDGFDEMSLNNQDAFLVWVKFILKETKVSVWITTRPNYKIKLENTLSAFSYSFWQDNARDRKYIESCLYTFWKTLLTFFGNNSHNFDFRNAAKIVTHHFIDIFEYENINNFFRGTLVLRMYAEKYVEVIKKILIQGITDTILLEDEIKKINTLQIYEAFVNNKYDIYFEKLRIKGALDEDSELLLRNAYSNAYGCLAVRKMSNRNERVAFNCICETSHSLTVLTRIGLIVRHDNFNFSTVFIHSSFTDYFATCFICSKLVNYPHYEPYWNVLMNGILVNSSSLKLFDSKLKGNNDLANIFNDDQSKNIVYQILDDQIKRRRYVALLEAAHHQLENTVIFLLKTLNLRRELPNFLQVNAIAFSNCRNINDFASLCLEYGPTSRKQRCRVFLPRSSRFGLEDLRALTKNSTVCSL